MSNFEKKTEVSTDDWVPCVPGVLDSYRFHSALNLETRRTALFQLVLIYGSGFFIAIATLTTLLKAPQNRPAQPSKMDCYQVQKMLDEYVRHSIVSVDLRASISQHLVECSTCDCVYQTMCGNAQELKHVEQDESELKAAKKKAPSKNCTPSKTNCD